MASKNVTKKIWEWAANVLVVVSIILVLFMLVAPRCGVNIQPVLTGSMEPALKVGSVIITRLVDADEVKKGDVISFKLDDHRITHRVIDITETDGRVQFQTKGDANEDPDPNAVIPRGDKVPRVIMHLPYLGFLAGLMKNKIYFLILVGIPALLLVTLYALDIWRELKNQQTEPGYENSREGGD